MLRAEGSELKALLEVVVVPITFESPNSCSARCVRNCGFGESILECGEAFEVGCDIVVVLIRGLVMEGEIEW